MTSKFRGPFLTCLAVLCGFACTDSSEAPGDTQSTIPSGDGIPTGQDALPHLPDQLDDQSEGSDVVSSVQLGTVTLVQDCVYPGATCKELTVTCPDLPPISVQLHVFNPQGTAKGTVVMGSGGGGTNPFPLKFLNPIIEAGFRVVERVWAEEWEITDKGTHTAACRYATLLTWISQQSWANGPLCVSGNSGGATEISYALARWDRGQIIDLAVPTSGPPMGRMDFGCIPNTDWEEECQEMVPDVVCDGQDVQCMFSPAAASLIDKSYEGSPCTDQNAEMGETLYEDSVVSPTSVYDYPDTPVHFLFGTDDCTSALPLGLLYAEQITSEVSVEYVDAPHQLFKTATGSQAIVSKMQSLCIDKE